MTDLTTPVRLIVGDVSKVLCDHQEFLSFKEWSIKVTSSAALDTYKVDNVTIVHWDEEGARDLPHLLNPCECGTFLPLDVEPGPMLSSSIGLLQDLQNLKASVKEIPTPYQELISLMMEMAELSIAQNQALEIR